MENYRCESIDLPSSNYREIFPKNVQSQDAILVTSAGKNLPSIEWTNLLKDAERKKIIILDGISFFGSELPIVDIDGLSRTICFVRCSFSGISLKVECAYTSIIIINEAKTNSYLTLSIIAKGGDGLCPQNKVEIIGSTLARLEIKRSDNYPRNVKLQNIQVRNSSIASLIIQDVSITNVLFSQTSFTGELAIKNLNCEEEATIDFQSCNLGSKVKALSLSAISGILFNLNKVNVDKPSSAEEKFSFNFSNLSDVKLHLTRCYFEKEVLFKGVLKNAEQKNSLAISETVFKDLVLFDDDNAEALELKETLFQNGVLIPVPKKDKPKCWICRIFKKTKRFLQRIFKKVEIPQEQKIHSSVWCTLKNQSLGRNDNNNALEYRKEEMRSYSSELKQQKGRFSEKIVLRLNCLSSVHGTRWDIALFFTIVVWLLFFSIFMWIREGFNFSGEFLPFTKPFWDGAVKFLWLPEGIEMLTDAISGSQCTGAIISMIIFYLLGKVGIGYGIFQTISAFRKHGK